MKTRTRGYFALAIVLIVSFKIFESFDKVDKCIDLFQMKPEGFRPLKTPGPLSVSESLLLKAFSVDWNITLKDNPWDVAARWVTQRYVIPENPVELGEFIIAYCSFLSTRIVHHKEMIIRYFVDAMVTCKTSA